MQKGFNKYWAITLEYRKRTWYTEKYLNFRSRNFFSNYKLIKGNSLESTTERLGHILKVLLNIFNFF